MDSTATVLGDRVQALAAALHDAGVSPERADAILGSASAATMHALTLVALLRRDRPRNLVAGPVLVDVEAAAALAA